MSHISTKYFLLQVEDHPLTRRLFAVDLRSAPARVLWTSSCPWRGNHHLVAHKVIVAQKDRLEFIDVRTGMKRFLNIPEENHLWNISKCLSAISFTEHNIAFARNAFGVADILVVDPSTETIRFIINVSSGLRNPFKMILNENVLALFTYGAGLTVWNVNDGALIQFGIINKYLSEDPDDNYTSIIFAEKQQNKLKIAYRTIHFDSYDPPPFICRITWLEGGNGETESLEVRDELDFQVPCKSCIQSEMYVVHHSLFCFVTWPIYWPHREQDMDLSQFGSIRVYSTTTGLSKSVSAMNQFYDIRFEEPIQVEHRKIILSESALIVLYRIPPQMGVSARLFSKNKMAIFDFS